MQHCTVYNTHFVQHSKSKWQISNVSPAAHQHTIISRKHHYYTWPLSVASRDTRRHHISGHEEFVSFCISRRLYPWPPATWRYVPYVIKATWRCLYVILRNSWLFYPWPWWSIRRDPQVAVYILVLDHTQLAHSMYVTFRVGHGSQKAIMIKVWYVCD